MNRMKTDLARACNYCLNSIIKSRKQSVYIVMCNSKCSCNEELKSAREHSPVYVCVYGTQPQKTMS